jgi:hypothetical protein
MASGGNSKKSLAGGLGGVGASSGAGYFWRYCAPGAIGRLARGQDHSGGNTVSSGEGDPLAPSSVVRMTCRDENRATQRRHVPFVIPFVTLSDSSSWQRGPP